MRKLSQCWSGADIYHNHGKYFYPSYRGCSYFFACYVWVCVHEQPDLVTKERNFGSTILCQICETRSAGDILSKKKRILMLITVSLLLSLVGCLENVSIS